MNQESTARGIALAKQLAQRLLHAGLTLSTAESCTGGGIAWLCTSLPGSSRWFTGSIVAYDNSVKQNLLGVTALDLESWGAVSVPVVRQMAQGACVALNTHAAISVTGIAGPDGGSAEKPVGTVFIGYALKGHSFHSQHHFPGNREDVRQASVHTALTELNTLLVRMGLAHA